MQTNGTTNDTLVQRSEALYERQLRTKLEPQYRGFFVAIEPDSGQYFLGKTMREALGAASRAFPNRMTFVTRIGHSAAIHLGASTA